MTKEDAKKEMMLHYTSLCKGLALLNEVNATVMDFAVIGDKAMLFSESVTDWIMSNDN